MNNYNRPVLSPPEAAVTDGQCNFGTYNGSIDKLNLLEADRPLGVPLPEKLNGLRLKEWEAIQIATQDWFLCLAVYNTKTVGTAIIMAYDRQKSRMHIYQHKVPYWKLHTPSGLANSRCYYHSDRLSIHIKNKLDEHHLDISFSARGFSNQPDIQGSFTGFYQTQPIVILQPFAKNRPLYSHKALMQSEGELTVSGRQTQYERHHCSMIMDDHKGFYPYVMQYDWVTGMGYNDQGKLQGFNLTDNQVKNHEKFNENCLWINGEMYPLPPIKIKRPEGVCGPWHIKDNYGQVNLTFTPLADVPNYLNLVIAETRYHGPTGMFKGTITTEKENVTFNECIGMGEQKYIRM